MTWDRLWNDKHGKFALVERPNAPLITWFVAMILSHVLPYGQANFAAALIAFGALFTWAWLEVFHGRTYARQILGAVVLLLSVVARL